MIESLHAKLHFHKLKQYLEQLFKFIKVVKLSSSTLIWAPLLALLLASDILISPKKQILKDWWFRYLEKTDFKLWSLNSKWIYFVWDLITCNHYDRYLYINFLFVIRTSEHLDFSAKCLFPELQLDPYHNHFHQISSHHHHHHHLFHHLYHHPVGKCWKTLCCK